MATSDAPRGSEAPVAVLKCSGCGAPLAPAKPGVAVECPSCGTDNEAKTGGEALVAEQADRARAEQLLASLGQPPSRLQRAAAATVHPSILVVFSPAILFVLFKVAAAVEWAVDAWRHERVAELDPTMAVLLSGGAFASVFLLFLLPWSLLGLRSDARRTLQAALACKPPTLDGGPSRCRECGADLTVPKGAYGVRCTYCSADNLLLLPRDWVESARNVQAGLRLGASEARRASKEAKEAIRRGMAWRAPALLGLIAFLTIRSVATARSKGAVWEDYLINEHVDGYGVRVGAAAERPRSLPRCDYGIGMWKLYTRSTLTLGPEGDCGTDKVLCGELVPLRRGDTLRVLWQSEPRAGQIRIGPAEWSGGWTGTDRWKSSPGAWQPLDVSTGEGGVAAEISVDMTGFKVIEVDAADGAVFQTCYLPATAPRSTIPTCPEGASWDAKAWMCRCAPPLDWSKDGRCVPAANGAEPP